MEKIGEVIDRRLRELRLTRADLARHLEVSKATVSYWISGTKRPTYERLEEIAGFLGCSVGELLGEKISGLDSIENVRLQKVLRNMIAAHETVLKRGDSPNLFLSSIEGLIETFRGNKD